MRLQKARVRLDPRIRGIDALGVEALAHLFDPEGNSVLEAEELQALADRTRCRFRLPGTPLEPGGLMTGEPRGVGTGWVLLERWSHAPLRALFRARLTHPRSQSLAERRWNLFCHLRTHGVGTPEPLVVGARAPGFFSRDSFLLTREIDGFLPLSVWLAQVPRASRSTGPTGPTGPTGRRAAERRRGLRAWGTVLGKVIHARVFLPSIDPDDWLVSKPLDLGDDSCALGSSTPPAQIMRGSPDAPKGLRLERTPSVIVTEVAGGSIRQQLKAEEIACMLRAFDRSELELTDRERASVLRVALTHMERSEKRSVRSLLRRNCARA